MSHYFGRLLRRFVVGHQVDADPLEPTAFRQDRRAFRQARPLQLGNIHPITRAQLDADTVHGHAQEGGGIGVPDRTGKASGEAFKRRCARREPHTMQIGRVDHAQRESVCDVDHFVYLGE